MRNPYHIIHKVFDGRDAQHHKQGHQRGVPCQGRDLRDCLKEIEKWQTCVLGKTQKNYRQATAKVKSNPHHHPAGILHSSHGKVPKHPANPSPASLSSFWLPGKEPRDRDTLQKNPHDLFGQPNTNLADYKNYVKEQCKERPKAVTSTRTWIAVPSGKIIKVWGDGGRQLISHVTVTTVRQNAPFPSGRKEGKAAHSSWSSTVNLACFSLHEPVSKAPLDKTTPYDQVSRSQIPLNLLRV